MKYLFLSLFILSSLLLKAADNYSPGTRGINWTNAGITNLVDIRASRTIYTNIPGVNGAGDGVDTNGVLDTSVIIQAALNNCPSNQRVRLPSGKLMLSNALSINYNQTAYAGYRTLEGAGKNLTTLIRATSAAAIQSGISGFWSSNLIDSSSLYQGSTNIKLFTAPSDFAAGATLYLSREDENATNFNIVWGNGYVTNTHIVDLGGGTYLATGSWYRIQSGDIMKQAVKCLNVSGTNLHVWPPISYSWTNESGLYAYLKGSQGGGVGIGIESLTITNQSDASIIVNFENCRESWLKDVKILGCQESLIMFNGTLSCEVTDSDIWNLRGTNITNLAGDKMGIQLLNAHFSKIENNSIAGYWNPIMMNSGSSGNYIGYNFFTNNFAFLSLPNRAEPDIFANHLGHCMMNLFEGNVMAGFHVDNYHGSSSHGTVYRNYIGMDNHALGFDLTNHLRAIDICRFGYYWNIVGNILGSPAVAARGASAKVYEAPIDGTFDAFDAAIYRVGFPYTGSDFVQPPSSNGAVFIFYAGGSGTTVNGFPIGYDIRVTNTLVRLNNYDYVNESVFDGTTNLVASLVYGDSQPLFYSGTGLTYPPSNPTEGTMQVIPAQYRYFNGDNPIAILLTTNAELQGKVEINGKVTIQ